MDAARAGSEQSPPDDPRLTDLIHKAAAGEVQLSYASIPVRYLRPFSATYKPVGWAPWVALVEIVKERLRHESASPLVVYQEGDFFVVSGDYATYYACLESDVASAPCLVLGEPVGDHVTAARPATPSEAQQALGISPPRTTPAEQPAAARPPASSVNIF